MKKLIKITVWALAFTVTLTVLFYAEENWRGARAWRKTAAELQAKGYPLTLSEIIPPPVADADNIAAAPIFAELFTADGDHNKNARLRKIVYDSKQMLLSNSGAVFGSGKELGDLHLFLDSPNETLTVRQTAEELLSKIDQKWTPLLVEVHTALQRPQCRWPVAYERGMEAQMPYFTACLDLMKILRLRAACYLAVGETAKAAADIDEVFKLAQAAESQPFMIACMISYTGRNISLPVFWSGIVNHQWRDEDLMKMQQTFAADDEFGKLKEAFVWERTTILDMDFIKKLPLIIRVTSEPSVLSKLELWLAQSLPSGVILSDKCFYAAWMQTKMDMIDAEAKLVSVHTTDEKQIEGLNNLAHPLTKLNAPGMGHVIKRMAQYEVSLNQAILACALERYRLRHGKLPLTLSELTPDFIEKIPNQVTVSDPMIYRRVSDSDYVLYSVGWDLRDDGGTISDDKRADQLDWVWASKPELYQRGKVAE